MHPSVADIPFALPDGFIRAQPSDWKRVADITAEAFRNDPVSRWVFGTPRGIRSAFRVLARTLYGPHGISYLAPAQQGATMWLPSGAPSGMGPLAQLSLAAGLLRYGGSGAVKRALAAGEAMDAHHPKTPHIYLFTIGVTEAGRGKGMGRQLMAPMLEACDADGWPVYLENSNPANHGFYARQGFERREIFHVGPDSPPLEAMWRDPR